MTAAMALSGYGIVKGKARGTNSWREGDEFNPIYYKKSKLSVYASGTFWLSDTPTKKSKISGSSYYRICTWACFQVKGKQEYILVFNTHLDFSETVKAKGLDAKVQSFTLKYSGRYIAENEGGDGIVKIIIDNEHRNIIGVHMIGNYASEIIYGAAMMVEKKMRVENVQKMVFPHPSVCEVIREGLFQI